MEAFKLIDDCLLGVAIKEELFSVLGGMSWN